VLSDWLIERGDPRGELIALQLRAARTKDDDKRAKALLAAHARDWMGPLATVMGVGTTTWERGFPASGRIAVKRGGDWERLAAMPELATLRALDLGGVFDLWGDDKPERIFFQPSLRHLREVSHLPIRLLAAVAVAEPPFALRRIACTPQMGGGNEEARDAALTSAFDDGRGLPHLVELELPFIYGRISEYPWLGTTRIGRQLEFLSITSYTPLAEWLEVLRGLDAATRLTTMRIAGSGWRATIGRSAPGAPWETMAISVPADVERATQAVAALPARTFATITIDGIRTPALEKAVARARR
jgi:hypothetical protein